MQITESQLRRYVSLLLKEAKRSPNALLVLEGPEIDRVQLIKKFPDSEHDISGLPPKWITWLSDRFGAAPKRTETHPLSDALPTVKQFSTKEAAIAQKWKSNEQFKKSVLSDELFSGTGEGFSPSDPTKLTVDQLERLIALAERKKQRFDIDKGSVEADRVGKVGRWNIWMPTTRENSCKIAGYDSVTMREKTTWCTARMSGSNLFYNYTGQPDHEITLFYIIADDPKLDDDWLSVGFINGRPELKGQGGGLSVDRSNQGLTEELLRKILGSDHDKIMQMMIEKNKALGGRHPSRDKIMAAAQSVDALQDLVRGLSEEEKTDLLNLVLREKEISSKVLAYLAGNKNEKVRFSVAINPSTPAEVLTQLANDEDYTTRRGALQNPNMPAEVLTQFAKDNDRFVLYSIVLNPNAPAEALAHIARSADVINRVRVLQHSNTPPEIVTQLLNSPDEEFRDEAASDVHTPAKFLVQLAKDTNKIVRQRVAGNINAPSEILVQLARDTDVKVRERVTYNRNTPLEIVTQLATDKNKSVRDAASKIRQLRSLHQLIELKQLIKYLI